LFHNTEQIDMLGKIEYYPRRDFAAFVLRQLLAK
jgi:hypothetical protein